MIYLLNIKPKIKFGPDSSSKKNSGSGWIQACIFEFGSGSDYRLEVCYKSVH